MRVAVVGSGPTGMVSALALAARQGVEVDLLDGGEQHEAPAVVDGLADTLRTTGQATPEQLAMLHRGLVPEAASLSARRALGVLSGRIDPRNLEKRILGSTFTFRGADRVAAIPGTWLPRSAAIGGLANAWGAACYPLRREDEPDWPFPTSELDPHYVQATALLGVTGEQDDLCRVYPLHGPLIPISGDCARDPGSIFESLRRRWRENAAELGSTGIHAGASRLAVRPPGAERDACVRCGLCAFGCALRSIWTPQRLLAAGTARGRLQHRPGTFVRAVEAVRNGSVLVVEGSDAQRRLGPYDIVLLAAGALGSLRIALASGLGTETTIQENDMFVVPMRVDPDLAARAGPVKFALSEAVMAMDPGAVAARQAHLQLYRPSYPLLGPIGKLLGALPDPIQRLAGRQLRSMVLGFLYLHARDSRRVGVRATSTGDLQIEADAGTPPRDILRRLTELLARTSHVTGLSPIAGLSRAMPLGFSAHLGATLPMTASERPLACAPDGSLRGAPGVYVVDMAALPAIPAQNATFTAIANALRITEQLVSGAV